MQKFEYVDLNRFLVSLGLALILGAATVFWLFLREPFDLAYTVEELETLTPVAKETIYNRQHLIGIAFHILPITCAVAAVVGFLCLVIGVWRWVPLQLTYEQIQKLQLRKLEIETQPMSEDQIQNKARVEVLNDKATEISSEEQGQADGAIDVAVAEYLETERTLLDTLSSRLPPHMELLPHRRFGPYSFDALIKPAESHGPNYLVEIKKLSENSNPKILIDAIESVSHATGWENLGDDDSVKRVPLIIAVAPTVGGRLLECITKYIGETNQNPTPFGQSLIRVITPDRLRSLSASDVHALLDITQRLQIFASEERGDIDG